MDVGDINRVRRLQCWIGTLSHDMSLKGLVSIERRLLVRFDGSAMPYPKLDLTLS